MIFLQPWMLWGLAAAGVPILIHFLNRWRYRTVRWGAMLFLRRITRSAMRRSRLRHYLILACRALAMAMIALAMTRPMVGGRIGAGLAGAPDAVLVLLDRSASMERTDPRLGASRRAQGLALLARLPPESVRGSRIVLIESAVPEPLEIASPGTLPMLLRTGPTDTAADAAAMLESALGWMERNRPGRAEIWMITDGQVSNWHPHAAGWPGLAARLAAYAPAVRAKLILLQSRLGENLSVQMREIRQLPDGGGEYELLVGLRHPGAGAEPVPAVRVLNGERTLLPLPAEAPETDHALRLPAPGEGAGWGWIELPADENPRDNHAYFVYGRGPTGTVWARTRDEAVFLRVHAALPAARGAPTEVRPWPAEGSAPDLSDASLVVWQGEPPTGATAAALDTFLRDGGVLLAMPGEEPADTPPPTAETPPPWQWVGEEIAAAERPYRVPRWEPLAAPTAHAADGRPLPIAEAPVFRRRRPVLPDTAEPFALAVFDDGEPALLRLDRGAGRLYLLATLPLSAWSGWGDGRLWVPLLWRMREEGARRISDIRLSRCGDPLPGDRDALWESVGTAEPRDPLIHAGIYRHGTRWLARNRPAEEDLPEELSSDDIRRLLPGVPIHALDDPAGRGDLYSEAAMPFLLLAALLLLTEAALALRDFSSAARNAPRADARGNVAT